MHRFCILMQNDISTRSYSFEHLTKSLRQARIARNLSQRGRATGNVLIGNGDMHLKNWSFTYRARRHAGLSPAYDFVSTLTYLPGDRSALAFSRGGPVRRTAPSDGTVRVQYPPMIE